MFQAFLNHIDENKLLTWTDRLIVGVSGGVDSMVLLHLIQQLNRPLVVAHVNYGLRADDADKDEALVVDWGREHGIPVEVKKVLPEEYPKEKSVQMAAREIRYDFFEKIRKETGFEKIVTAHHHNDNVETVLLNLVKGTGIRGLTGIAPIKDGYIIRPLLFAQKHELENYAKEQGIHWREDVTNQKSVYQRNRLRNEVIPLLREINPSLEQTFFGSLERFKGLSSLVDKELSQLKAALSSAGSRQILDLSWYESKPASKYLLYEFIRTYGFGWKDAQELARSIEAANTGATFYSENFEITLDRNALVIGPNEMHSTVRMSVGPEDQTVTFAGKTFQVKNVVGVANLSKNPRVGCLDRAKLTFPLTLRSWKRGDRFQPLGMRGQKKVSDFMIDNKIPLSLKREVLVLESEGNIVWVVGYRLDERFKVNPTTSHLWIMECDEAN